MIRKLRSLLDETTILNFKFVYKLAKRYKILVVLCLLLSAIAAIYFYKTQNEIYSAQISFRYIKEDKASGTTAVSAILEDQDVALKSSEVIGIISSTNFLQYLALDLRNDKDIELLNFNPIHAKKQYTYGEYTADCADETCHLNFLRSMIVGLFSVQEDDFINNKYNVTVKTLSLDTTEKLIKYIESNILKYRLNTIKGQLQSQIKITSQLIEKEDRKVEGLNLKEMVQKKSILEDSLSTLLKKISLYSLMINEKKIDLEQAQISLKYTKKTLNKKISNRDKKEFEELTNLNLKKQMLSADITALEHSIGSQTEQDDLIVKTLKVELAKIDKQLEKLEGLKKTALFVDFADKKLKDKGTVEFNVKVLKDQISGLEKSITTLNVQRNDLIAQINETDNYIVKNEAVLNYLKLLQNKLLQLKLIEDTIVSDLVFDDYLSISRRFKKYSLFAVIPFSMALSFCILLLVLVTRYLFDNRLLDKEEFSALFDDIEFIGDIPEL